MLEHGRWANGSSNVLCGAITLAVLVIVAMLAILVPPSAFRFGVTVAPPMRGRILAILSRRTRRSLREAYPLSKALPVLSLCAPCAWRNYPQATQPPAASGQWAGDSYRWSGRSDRRVHPHSRL